MISKSQPKRQAFYKIFLQTEKYPYNGPILLA
jgi:hypothetical protein